MGFMGQQAWKRALELQLEGVVANEWNMYLNSLHHNLISIPPSKYTLMLLHASTTQNLGILLLHRIPHPMHPPGGLKISGNKSFD